MTTGDNMATADRTDINITECNIPSMNTIKLNEPISPVESDVKALDQEQNFMTTVNGSASGARSS